MDHIIDLFTVVKPATINKWKSTIIHLVNHFGANCELRNISAGDADEFRSFLYKQNLAENTVRRYCGIAKQFFRSAERRKLIDKNPFLDQVAAVKGNAEKFHFIKRADAEKIINSCPDLQWRMIFILCRFDGLRCPSEVLALRWQDIDWTQNRFIVHSSKTEHHEGKASRVVPLFPELADILSEGFQAAPEGSTFVITRYRDATQNLRSTFQKIVKRAGLEVWPKLFQNLRSTRETELADEFPLHVVTAWIGNSTLVAAKYYLQVTDEHFEEAATAQVGQKASEMVRTGKPAKFTSGKKSLYYWGIRKCSHFFAN